MAHDEWIFFPWIPWLQEDRLSRFVPFALRRKPKSVPSEARNTGPPSGRQPVR